MLGPLIHRALAQATGQDIARHANRITYIRDGSVERDEIVSKPSPGCYGFTE